MPDARLERLFPKLARAGYRVMSPANPRYNCIAWAAGTEDTWWWPPGGFNGHYWPASAPGRGPLLLVMPGVGAHHEEPDRWLGQ